MPGPGNILIRVGAEAGQAVRELGTVDKSLGKTMTTSEKMGATVKKAALPAAVALGAIGVAAIDATKAAMEDAAAQEHLAGVLKRTAGVTDAQVKATEDWITSVSRATGVTDDELRPAMETLVTATKDVGKSQKYMQQALDISAASGKDLESVSKAIALAHTGQTAKLEKLVPGLSKAAKESDNMNTIMTEYATITGGAMADSTETAAGQFKIFQNQTNELKESLGAALLPVVTALTPLLVDLADVASKNTTVIKILVGIVAGLAAGILAVNAALKVVTAAKVAWAAATKIATAAQWLWNTAMSANPIGIIIVALAAMTAGIVLAYQRSATFRNIVGDAMDAVTGAVKALDRALDALKASAFVAWDWITAHWKLALFAFGPIGAAVYLISENFERIERMARGAFGYITGAVGKVIEAIQKLIDWLGKVKMPKLKLPGGIHIPGTLLAAPAGAGGYAAGGAAGRSGAPAPVTVNVYGAIDPEGTARAIRRVLASHDRRQGRTV